MPRALCPYRLLQVHHLNIERHFAKAQHRVSLRRQSPPRASLSPSPPRYGPMEGKKELRRSSTQVPISTQGVPGTADPLRSSSLLFARLPPGDNPTHSCSRRVRSYPLSVKVGIFLRPIFFRNRSRRAKYILSIHFAEKNQAGHVRTYVRPLLPRRTDMKSSVRGCDREVSFSSAKCSSLPPPEFRSARTPRQVGVQVG